MRNLLLIAVATGAGVFALAQTASAERVCKSVCDGGSCVQKCIEHDDAVIVDRPPPPPGVGVRVPGVDVEIGR
jgi:hypothetical protein